ncbi:MAG: methylmalonyl-CoA mutase N-terminal domain/subunit, partial [Parasphingorhabdus sp.]
RDEGAVTATLNELVRTARNADENIMPATIAAVRANVSMGEIVEALVPLFGRYTETPTF